MEFDQLGYGHNSFKLNWFGRKRKCDWSVS